MSNNLRSSKGSSKKPPVIIHLQRSGAGYKVLDEASFSTGTIISLSKNMLYASDSTKATENDKQNNNANSSQRKIREPRQKQISVTHMDYTNSYKEKGISKRNIEPLVQPPAVNQNQNKPEIFPYNNNNNYYAQQMERKKEAEMANDDNDEKFDDQNKMQDDSPKPVKQEYNAQNQQYVNQSTPSMADPNQSMMRPPQRKKYQLVIPSCASWFEIEKIHQIEKESLAEFFQNKLSKSAEVYKKYRNYIIQLYRQNPRTYLTATTCRRNLAGDVCAILRIHAFLEHWGLINFNVDPKSQPQSILLNKSMQNMESLYKVDNTKIDMFDREKEIFDKGAEGDLIFNSMKMLSKNFRPVCDFCGIICGLVWFQQKILSDKASKVPELVLCVKCFTEGNYPSILSERDFIKVDLINKLQSGDSQRLVKNPWPTDETLKLLELIEKNHENWDEIQKYFGPERTREEIILHFLQLPLKNISSVHLFDNQDENDDANKLPIERLVDEEPNVFSDMSNPLMHHIGIFKGLLDKKKQMVTKQIKEKKEEEVNAIKSEAIEIEKVDKDEKEKEDDKEENKENNANQSNEQQIEQEIPEVKEEETIKQEDKDNMQVEETKSVKSDKSEKSQKKEEIQTITEESKEKAKKFVDNMTKMAELNENEQNLITQIEDKTKQRSNELKNREEKKIQTLANLLIDIQLNKLENKLNYLEEYEKLIWYEKNQLEVYQRLTIAETVSLQFRKNDLNKQLQNQTQNLQQIKSTNQNCIMNDNNNNNQTIHEHEPGMQSLNQQFAFNQTGMEQLQNNVDMSHNQGIQKFSDCLDEGANLQPIDQFNTTFQNFDNQQQNFFDQNQNQNPISNDAFPFKMDEDINNNASQLPSNNQ